MKHPSALPPQPDRTPRRRGSVIILVVVAIGLMAFIGATYLQVARVQRQVVAEPVDNIDLVLQSVRQEIATQLKEDVFDPATGLYFPETFGIEPYDRAWVNLSGPTYPVYGIDGETGAAVGTANGGALDDTWLASSTPHNPGSAWTWRKITSLTGGFYDADGTDDRFVRDTASGDDPDQYGGAFGVDINVSAFLDPSLVDADADGMYDSRWERAPIALKDGVEYFMAVRVIDPSAFINANVATIPYDTGGAYDDDTTGPVDAVLRGTYPSELDLGRYVASSGGGLAQAIELLQDGRGVTGFDWGERERFWLDAGRRLGNPDTGTNAYAALTTAEEAELRYRGGAYDLPDLAGVLEAEMGAFITTDSTGDIGTDGISDDAEATAHYGYGNYGRPRMTVVSAEAVFAPTLPDESVTTRIQKFPLNDVRLLVDDTATVGVSTADPDRDAALLELAEAIETVYAYGPALEMPGGFPATAAGAEQMGRQFAASLQDFRDADNRLTYIDPNGSPGDGDEALGFEALPAITEVYVQQEYTYSAPAGPQDLDAEGDDPDYDGTWTKATGAEPSFGIEVRNPFNKRISLRDVFISVDGATPLRTGTVAADVDLPANNGNGDGLIDLAEIVGREFMEADEVLILYRNDGATNRVVADDVWGAGVTMPVYNRPIGEQAGSADSQVDDSNFNIFATPYAYQNDITEGFTFSFVEIELGTSFADGREWPEDVDTAAAPAPAGGFNGDDFTIRLGARTTATLGSGQEIVTYQEAPGRAMPDSFDQRYDDLATSPAGATSWAQATFRGNAHKVNMLAVPRDDFVEGTSDGPDPAINAPEQRFIPSHLGWPSKFGGPADPNADRFSQGGTSENFKAVAFTTVTVGGGSGVTGGRTVTAASAVLRTWALNGLFPDQWPIADYDDNRIDTITRLAQLVVAGPSFGQTVAERLDAAAAVQAGVQTDMREARIDLESGQQLVPLGGTAVLNLNHAEFLFSRLTTYSPHADGIDNDGDGDTDEDSEQAVPGRLNLHAADSALVAEVFPVSDPTVRGTIANELARFGIELNPDQRGIAHPAELFAEALSPVLQQDQVTDDMDTKFELTTPTRIDLFNNDLTDVFGFDADRIADDLEERLLFYNRINQVMTTRSDVFIGYVLVHGYKSGAFVDGPVEVGREIVLFDRTGLVTNDDAVVSSVLYRFP